MSKYKNYKNGYTKENIIHTIEDLVGMSLGEIAKREKELVSQYKQIGMPSNADMKNSSNVVFVESYTRSDGTVVKAHWRSKGESAGSISDQASDFISSGKQILKSQIEKNVKISNVENLYNKIKDKVVQVKDKLADIKDISKKSLNLAGGYILPSKKSKNYNLIDMGALQFNIDTNQNRPDAKQMLEIGIYGVDSYDNNNQFKHIKDGSADLYNEKYKLTGNKTIPSDMKGIEFSSDSDFAKRISKDKKFQQIVKNAINKNNGKIPDKIELNFTKDKNLNYSVGHGTLLNPKVTEDGYIEGVVFDKYDYNLLRKEYYDNYPATIYNNGAWGLQKIKHLEDYYYFIPIRFKY